jgi:hypothetical protein
MIIDVREKGFCLLICFCSVCFTVGSFQRMGPGLSGALGFEGTGVGLPVTGMTNLLGTGRGFRGR